MAGWQRARMLPRSRVFVEALPAQHLSVVLANQWRPAPDCPGRRGHDEGRPGVPDVTVELVVTHRHGEAPSDEVLVVVGLLRRQDDPHLQVSPLGTLEELDRRYVLGDVDEGGA